MSTNERELDELLGAYALDAVSPEERRLVEEYLLVDPRARAEVQEHREVASMLAWTGASAPDGLWDRIAGQLDDRAPAPSGELAAVLAFDAGITAAPGRDRTTGARATRTSASGGRRWRPVLAWAGGTVAAAAIAVFAVAAFDRDGSDRSPMEAAVEAARNDGDSMVTTLVAADGTFGGEAIIDRDGHGYLVLGALPELTTDRTYQLWGVIDGEAISLGVLGNHPAIETFTAEGELTQLVVTNEVAGGVITDGNPDGAYAGTVA